MKKHLVLIILLISFLVLPFINIPSVKAVATYYYDGWDIYITGATANFAGWYNADISGGWGTIGRTSTNDYYLDSNYVFTVYIGNSTNSCTFKDWSKQIDFDGVVWEIANNSLLEFGRISPTTNQPQNPIQIIGNYEIKVLADGTLNLYASSIDGGKIVSVSDNSCEFYGCDFTSIELSVKNFDMDKCVLNLAYFRGLDYEIGGQITNIFQHRGNLVLITDNYNVTVENTICSVTEILSTIPIETWTGSCNLSDVVSNSWLVGWDGVNDTGVLWRKNSYDLTVTYPNGTAINGTLTGARVVIRHYGFNSGIDFNGTLNENGTIITQKLIVGFYNATGDDTIYDYNNYNLQIYNITGYEEYNVNFTHNGKQYLVIALIPSPDYSLAITLLISCGVICILLILAKKKMS